jgi:hypothetical protein
MKIIKFNENLESEKPHVFSFERIGDGYSNYRWLFDNYTDAFNFIANKVYFACKKEGYDSILEQLDEINDIDSMVEFYDEIVDEHDTYDRISYIHMEFNESVKLYEWIELRRNAKKYNL